MSTVMRCKMGVVHEFELGMTSMVDLKYKVIHEARRADCSTASQLARLWLRRCFSHSERHEQLCRAENVAPEAAN